MEETTDITERRTDAHNREEHKIIIDRLEKIEEGYNEMGKTIVKLETNVEGFEKLVDRFEGVLNRMNFTLGELNTTIVKINTRVDINTGHLSNLDSRVDNVNERLTTVDNKGKIDFLTLVKDNFGKFLFGGSALAIAIYWIDHIIDSYMIAKGVGK